MLLDFQRSMTVDSFALGGNKVSFDEDPNVRGRLGLRVGTSTAVWAGTTMEPFVIGSLWGDLSGDRQATGLGRQHLSFRG